MYEMIVLAMQLLVGFKPFKQLPKEQKSETSDENGLLVQTDEQI